MARNRLLYRGGSPVLRSPILKWSNLRVLRGGVEDFRSVSRPMARRSFGLSASERRSEMEVDISHRCLWIDEISLSEGSSGRVKNQADEPLVDAKGPQETDMRSSALAPYLQRAEASGSPDWSESAVEPKH